MKKKRILLFTGGNLGEWALEEIKTGDILVGVDRGAYFLLQHHRKPDISLGDFDSVTTEEADRIQSLSGQFLSCDPVMKDLTDTEMAFAWALEQKPDEIIILGGLGSRFDHSLANVHLLLKGLTAGISTSLLDEKNEIWLMDKQLTVAKGSFSHVSLLPLTMEVTEINLKGFQYPLHDATLRIGDSLGISNVLADQEGSISIGSGYLLVIKSRD